MKSRLNTPKAEIPMPTAKAKRAVIATKGKTHSINQLNFILNHSIIPIKTIKAMRKSNNAVITAENGNTS